MQVSYKKNVLSYHTLSKLANYTLIVMVFFIYLFVSGINGFGSTQVRIELYVFNSKNQGTKQNKCFNLEFS